MNRPLAFTLRAQGTLRSLVTKCRVSEAHDPNGPAKQLLEFNALWDTGATSTSITQKIVDALGLAPTGLAKVHHADGESMVPTFLVNVRLPNEVGFAGVKVTLAKLTGIDVLIGMDIISAGDFVLTNKSGKTVFTFRIPSMAEIDFVQGTNSQQIGRNDPCPCKSGKKFKNCCSGK